MREVVLLFRKFIVSTQNSIMPKLRLVLLTVIFASSGFGCVQAATATQLRSQTIRSIFPQSSIEKDVRFFTLAKKCTIRRYRRPH
jgi:hypothetical protein